MPEHVPHPLTEAAPQPLDDLVDFARSYAALDDGWMTGRDLPPLLCDTTLARIPAAMIVTREGVIQ